MNKIVLIVLPVLAVTALVMYRLAAENSELSDLMAVMQARMQQQLVQVEQSSQQRLHLENQIETLGSQLTESRSRLTALNRELETTRQQVNPDYGRMEREIREQVAREYRQQNHGANRNPGTPLSRAELIDELGALQPMEMAQLMSLQGRYGAFLQSLDVDDQRREVIIDALDNYLTEQNNARRDLMTQARADGFDPRQIRGQMVQLDSPQARRESLSYAFTEADLQALEQFEQNRQSGVPFQVGTLRAIDSQGGRDSADGVFISNGNFALAPGGEVIEHTEVITSSTGRD